MLLKYGVVLTLIFTLGSAHAAENTIVVDLSSPVSDAFGEQKQECTKPDESGKKCLKYRDVTLGILFVEVLDPDPRVDQEMHDPVMKAKAGLLAQRIIGNLTDKSFKLSVDDVTLLRTQVGKFADNLTIARIQTMIDPASAPAQ